MTISKEFVIDEPVNYSCIRVPKAFVVGPHSHLSSQGPYPYYVDDKHTSYVPTESRPETRCDRGHFQYPKGIASPDTGTAPHRTVEVTYKT